MAAAAVAMETGKRLRQPVLRGFGAPGPGVELGAGSGGQLGGLPESGGSALVFLLHPVRTWVLARVLLARSAPARRRPARGLLSCPGASEASLVVKI